jgi:hypothetical protein
VKCDIQTVCCGIAMSMGAFLLAGGTKGKRLATANSRIMIHQVSSGFQGQATDIEIQARETLSLRKKLDEMLAENCNQDYEKVAKDTERDYYMSSLEASEYGLIDRIVGKVEEADVEKAKSLFGAWPFRRFCSAALATVRRCTSMNWPIGAKVQDERGRQRQQWHAHRIKNSSSAASVGSRSVRSRSSSLDLAYTSATSASSSATRSSMKSSPRRRRSTWTTCPSRRRSTRRSRST